MWSSVVLFILTFAVFGLLLGFATVYNTNQDGKIDGATIRENASANITQGSPSSSSSDMNAESG
jgi:hypothetical protein